jgi:AcrR family transcriptional regulator
VSSVDDPPAPGTRPKNRRALTISAATELFYRRGYQSVSVADIARATNVGSSAIFRHFPTKSELLVAAIRSGISAITQILAAPDPGTPPAGQLEFFLTQLAEFVLGHPASGVLWQREARSLDVINQRIIREEFRTISQSLSDVIRNGRPEVTPAQADLLAWCSIGALASVGFHSLALPHDEYVALLVDFTLALVSIELPEPSATTTMRLDATLSGESRRDELINLATELFAERGFAAVAIDEIGTAAGIAGPSIYSHFESKQKLLLAVIERGNAVLQAEAASALAADGSPEVKLRLLVDSYVGLAIRDRFLVRIVLSEVGKLAEADREYARRAQRKYIDAWTDLLLRCGGDSPISARIRVQAVLLVISDAVQTPHLRVQAGFESSLSRIATALLGLPGASV